MYTVSLDEIIKEFQLEIVTKDIATKDVEITTSDINRPGLQFAGFTNYFAIDRMQIIGKVEMAYLGSLSNANRNSSIKKVFGHKFSCVVITRGLKIYPEILNAAKKYNIIVLRTKVRTSQFIAGLIRFLNLKLAPRTTIHGGLVEVYGEGILILGESGVGKSETALELVKRGHRLIADDVVEIRKVSDKTLLGRAPGIIRYLIEIRGIGIIDVKNLYGVGSIKEMESIDLVIKLEYWREKKEYERLGLSDKFTEILETKVPYLNIPVKPGRNLAIVMEVAAKNNRQKKMGYNAAKELNERALGSIENKKKE